MFIVALAGNGKVSLSELDLYVKTKYPSLNSKPALMRFNSVLLSDASFYSNSKLVGALYFGFLAATSTRRRARAAAMVTTGWFVSFPFEMFFFHLIVFFFFVGFLISEKQEKPEFAAFFNNLLYFNRAHEVFEGSFG